MKAIKMYTHIQLKCTHINVVKGKAIPIQAWAGP